MLKWLFFVPLFFCLEAQSEPKIWVWPGAYRSLANKVADRSVLVLQRHFDSAGTASPRGPSPWPWPVRDLTLVFRLQSRPRPQAILSEFLKLKSSWEQNKVKVVGLQIDFDSPSGKLKDYSDDLTLLSCSLKKIFPSQDLSVTGLTDWLTKKDVHRMSGVTVYFQLYQGSAEHLDADMHLGRLSKVQFPFFIGLLPKQALSEEQRNLLVKNNRFQGFAEFHGGSL